MAENDPEIAHDAQVTPAHVLDAVNSFKADVMPRLAAVEKTANASYDILKAAGILNGKGEELIQMVKERRASDRRSDAWRSVAADITHWLRWLTPTRGWVKFLIAAAVGGAFTGWASNGHLPHIPGF